MNEQLFKPIQEATYLTVPNAWRYLYIADYEQDHGWLV